MGQAGWGRYPVVAYLGRANARSQLTMVLPCYTGLTPKKREGFFEGGKDVKNPISLGNTYRMVNDFKRKKYGRGKNKDSAMTPPPYTSRQSMVSTLSGSVGEELS